MRLSTCLARSLSVTASAAALAFACADGAEAATSRSSWVVSQVYAANPPFAATDATDLATKMSTTAASAYAFYRGTDQIFMADMATLPPSAYATTQTGDTWLGGDTSGAVQDTIATSKSDSRSALLSKYTQVSGGVRTFQTIAGAAYYVHEKSPWAEDFDPTQLTSAGKLKTAATYLGQALASAHAVSDQDYDSAIVPYGIDKQVSNAVTSKSGFESEIAAFAFDYAAQVQLDWQSFVAACQAGTPLY